MQLFSTNHLDASMKQFTVEFNILSQFHYNCQDCTYRKRGGRQIEIELKHHYPLAYSCTDLPIG